jgi:hypothetical protein
MCTKFFPCPEVFFPWFAAWFPFLLSVCFPILLTKSWGPRLAVYCKLPTGVGRPDISAPAGKGDVNGEAESLYIGSPIIAGISAKNIKKPWADEGFNGSFQDLSIFPMFLICFDLFSMALHRCRLPSRTPLPQRVLAGAGSRTCG